MDPLTALGSPSTASAATQPDARRAALTSDFDTFLKMLTAQAQNQDPLDPLDATDYATQLATFSTVEQQVMTNDLLTEIAAGAGGPSVQKLTAWIGAEVMAPGPAAFDGQTPLTYRADVAEGATTAQLVVRDDTGRERVRRSISLDGGELGWDGRDVSGAALPAGNYDLSIDSFAGDRLLDSRPAETFARVIEARSGPEGETRLRLVTGAEIDASEIADLRVGRS